MQVVNCTTPANFFHVLRRQLHWPFRAPLVVFTPKSLLRHPKCVSTMADLSDGIFKEVIDDSIDKKKVKRVGFCSGKIYYDLLQHRETTGRDDVAIVRLEQMYPFPQEQLDKVVKSYPNCKSWAWIQEEPENMGAWHFILRKWKNLDLECIARHESGSPASGSMKRFQIRQKEILERLFN